MPYDNIKSHKKPVFHPLFRKYIFRKTTGGVKMVNHCEGHVIFQDIKHQLQENIIYHVFHYSFFMKNPLNREVS